MSKGSGMGSKRDGSHTNKGMGKCTDKHCKQCGDAEHLRDKHAHDKKHKHSYMDMESLEIIYPKNASFENRLDDLL